jgi:hypothetical protein
MPLLPATRRTFLAGGAALAAAGPLAAALQACARPGTPLRDSARARAIGARYAERYPEGADGLWRGRPPASDAEWAPRIAALRREDFEADRLVQVDGWWLAETELRLCVLLYTAA